VHAQVGAAVEERGGAVASIEFDQLVATNHLSRVVGYGDDEVEDHVIRKEVEEMVSVHQAPGALFDAAEERGESTKILKGLGSRTAFSA